VVPCCPASLCAPRGSVRECVRVGGVYICECGALRGIMLWVVIPCLVPSSLSSSHQDDGVCSMTAMMIIKAMPRHLSRSMEKCETARQANHDHDDASPKETNRRGILSVGRWRSYHSLTGQTPTHKQTESDPTTHHPKGHKRATGVLR
jgi:hypothetical protein